MRRTAKTKAEIPGWVNGDRLRSPFARPSDLVWIFAGGAMGAWARYGLTSAWSSLQAGDPMWGTMGVNLLGTVTLAALIVRNPGRRLRMTFGIGFLGSFTTFSAFAVEALDAGLARGAVYVLLSVGLGWVAVQIGARTG